MGKEIVYCNVCGERILESEFNNGRAVTILKKNYCRKCAKAVVKANANQDVGDKGGVKSPSPRKLQLRPAPPSDQRDSPPKNVFISTPFIIGIAIVIFAIILLIVVLSRGSGP